jgi:MFS transporter, PAT family, beta-lactamase induction signal transducer AmpG
MEMKETAGVYAPPTPPLARTEKLFRDSSGTSPVRHPVVWVPSLYFAQGLPWAIVSIMAAIMYKKMGISNEQIAYWTGLLGFAWVLKPLWSPFLEMVSSPKKVVVAFQLIGGVALLACALVLHLPGFFTFSIAILAVSAFSSATHDIAADGSYISNLSKEQQAMYSGWLGAFWNGGKLFAQGALVTLAGLLEPELGVAKAWSVVMALPGVILLALAFYHMWAMPAKQNHDAASLSFDGVLTTLKDVTLDFFAKPGIWFAVSFIILFRAGEGLVQTVGRLFLIESLEKGGLGLTTTQVGIAYGTVATLMFIGGSILGGYFVAWKGLKKTLFLLILLMNVPNLTFWYMSAYLPTDIYFISAILSIEMLGYGIGFNGLIVYIMHVVAPGKYPTAHYAMGTGIMALGLTVFQMLSGKIQQALGYPTFFIVGVLACIPVLVMAAVAKIPDTTANPGQAGGQ